METFKVIFCPLAVYNLSFSRISFKKHIQVFSIKHFVLLLKSRCFCARQANGDDGLRKTATERNGKTRSLSSAKRTDGQNSQGI
jgi:hypothetical protein